MSLERDKLETDKLERDKLERDKLERDKLERDKLERDKLETDKKEETKVAGLDGLVYRILGPGGKGYMWIAHAANGYVSHGRTPDGAVEGLKVVMSALAEVAGQPLGEWLPQNRLESTLVLRDGGLLQAGSRERDAARRLPGA